MKCGDCDEQAQDGFDKCRIHMEEYMMRDQINQAFLEKLKD